MEDIVVGIANLLYNSNRLWFVESGQIEKIRLLVEFIEYSAGSVFDVGRRKNGNGIFRKACCKLRTSLVIFLGGDARRD